MTWLRRVAAALALGRSLMIIVTPLLLLQVVTTSVFYESHWDTVTKRLARGVAGDIATVIALMPADGDAGRTASACSASPAPTMQLDIDFVPGARLPVLPGRGARDPGRSQARPTALQEFVQAPLPHRHALARDGGRDPRPAGDGVLQVVAPRRRLFSSTTYIFILWMVGSSLALFAVAILFMRNQVRPIRQLAGAAEAFGKGRDVAAFRLVGASEVRQAAAAFNQMRDRIRRQIAQRTEMLAGVSHDLRTPLTRMKLELAMLGDGAETADLKADVAEMEKMLERLSRLRPRRGPRAAGPRSISQELLREVVNAAAPRGRRHRARRPRPSLVDDAAARRHRAAASPT